jgi:hypothetical protein
MTQWMMLRKTTKTTTTMRTTTNLILEKALEQLKNIARLFEG